MRSIQRRFNLLTHKKSEWSSFISFSDAIKGQGFSQNMIARWFNKLVGKDDYDKKDKKKLIQHLWELSKGREESEFESIKGAPARV